MVDGVKKQNVRIRYKQYSYYTFDLFDDDVSDPPPHPEVERREAELYAQYLKPWEEAAEEATG